MGRREGGGGVGGASRTARALGSKWLPCGSCDLASHVWREFDPVSETCFQEKSCKARLRLLPGLSDDPEA